MGTKYRLFVKTAALAAVVFLMAGCVQISTVGGLAAAAA